MPIINVAATSANIGSGFDSLGLALDYFNRVEIYENDHIEIVCEDGGSIPLDETNLVYSTANYLYERCGRKLQGLTIKQQNNIPIARGLGSSSACIVAGLVGANMMMGSPIPNDALLSIAATIEGHADNVAPAMLGGFVTSVIEGEQLYYHRKAISEHLRFICFVPDFMLLTTKARAVLPKEITHKDAVYNISRAALATAAFCEGRYDLLAIATGDKIQQQYRFPLITGAAQIFEITKKLNAKACYISGAGPTIMAVIDKSNADFSQNAKTLLQGNEETKGYTLLSLLPCNKTVFETSIL